MTAGRADSPDGDAPGPGQPPGKETQGRGALAKVGPPQAPSRGRGPTFPHPRPHLRSNLGGQRPTPPFPPPPPAPRGDASRRSRPRPPPRGPQPRRSRRRRGAAGRAAVPAASPPPPDPASPPPARHSHQLPPVRPSSSFFSEFQMNFFQLPSPSLAFPRAMASGGAGERRGKV